MILLFGCVYVINVIALSFVWNIYLSESTMNDVLFGARKSEINRGVSTDTLLVIVVSRKQWFPALMLHGMPNGAPGRFSWTDLLARVG